MEIFLTQHYYIRVFCASRVDFWICVVCGMMSNIPRSHTFPYLLWWFGSSGELSASELVRNAGLEAGPVKVKQKVLKNTQSRKSQWQYGDLTMDVRDLGVYIHSEEVITDARAGGADYLNVQQLWEGISRGSEGDNFEENEKKMKSHKSTELKQSDKNVLVCSLSLGLILDFFW